MKRGQGEQVVLECGAGATEPALQAPDLRDARFDPERLARQTYLSTDEAIVHLRFDVGAVDARAARKAFQRWCWKTQVARCGSRSGLFLRRDLEEAMARTPGQQKLQALQQRFGKKRQAHAAMVGVQGGKR